MKHSDRETVHKLQMCSLLGHVLVCVVGLLYEYYSMCMAFAAGCGGGGEVVGWGSVFLSDVRPFFFSVSCV